MCTLNKMWGIIIPEEATAKIGDKQYKKITGESQSLEK